MILRQLMDFEKRAHKVFAKECLMELESFQRIPTPMEIRKTCFDYYTYLMGAASILLGEDIDLEFPPKELCDFATSRTISLIDEMSKHYGGVTA